MSIKNYYQQKYADFKNDISVLTEDKILEIDSKQMAQAFFEEIKLPYLLKDESRPVKKETISKIYFEETDDRDPDNEDDHYIGRLRKTQWLQVTYPIKPNQHLEEVLKRTTDHEISSVEYASARFKCDRIEIQSPVLSKIFTSDVENYTDEAVKMRKMNELVQELEEKIAKKNQMVESYNYSFPIWVTDYLEKFKKIILNDQKKQKSDKLTISRSVQDSEQDDDYDDAHQRTANDDRSDSLNPNNSSYQAAQNNHSDQLNTNNSRYQGE